MRRLGYLVLAAVFVVPLGVSAQGFAIAGQAGTAGIGGSVILGLSPSVNIRGSAGFLPFEPEFDVDDVDFTVEFPAFLRGTIDFYPTGVFYISGGGLFVTDDGGIDVTGTFTGTQEFGDNTYTAAEVGDLLGTFSLDSAMPYLGIGFGNPVGRRVGVNLDLGVGFGTKPDVALSATGPINNDPQFQADLQEREQEIRDDIPEVLRYYPVISLSLSIGLGR